ncbi:MAG: mercury methylation corrinoid protein HgcA, partial [Desulfobulbales bacterium]|nr:mercury methylation corrinoid protein HgcA [Desulfobulbales bacterium]
LDTRGVNVWCAAGKKTFSTEEVIHQVHRVGLDRLVSHRELILPQLGAPGVSAQAVKKGCGFKVIWGPIRAQDLKTFLTNGRKTEPSMRQLTFSMGERIVLIPVELSLIVKPSLAILLLVFLLSGIGPDIFSLSAAWFRGLNGALAYLLGVAAGAIIVPILLPWLPTRQFYIKGLFTGLLAGFGMIFSLGAGIDRLEALTLLLLTAVVSSYAAMNFTGATPFTSPSGVEKEMRQGIPVQIIATAAAIVAWVAAPFVN